MASSNMSLKLLIDRKKQRVLFAEAGKDFIDFLSSILASPVSTVIGLLNNTNFEVGLTKFYQSISDLKDDYIQSNQNKDALLKLKVTIPFSSSQDIPLLSIKASSSPSNSTASLYKCGTCGGSCRSITYNYNQCPYCRNYMSTVDDSYVLKSAADAKGGGFVKGSVTYMVTDDLAVSPMLSTISNITWLKDFNIKDFDAVEEKVVDIGMDEGLELLKHSLISKTVLTDALLPKVTVKGDNP